MPKGIGRKYSLKSSSIQLAAFSLLMMISACGEKESQRSIQVELPNQWNNLCQASQPGIGCWFWVEQEFQPEGYKPFIDLYARHTNFRLLTTSIRHDRWVGDPAVHDQVKAAATYALANDMGIVFDLDVRHSRELFRAQYPDEQQELVRMREINLMDTGTVSLDIEGMEVGDHYTFGPAPDYDSYASRLLRVYSYDDLGNKVQDITDHCKVELADGKRLQVSIVCTARDRGRKACVMAAFTMFTPDVFSPHLSEFEKNRLKQYADVPLAGACKDEWGFPGRFEPSTSDLWYSESMMQFYANRRPGHDLVRDMLLMFKGESGKQTEQIAAVNYYMQMVWQQCAKVENLYYESIKEVFGEKAMAMTHPTWVPFPNNQEIFKNGLDWWSVHRDLAQTDESTPYCVRTALSKKWHSPLWYNMYYDKSLDSYKAELWQSVLGGGRLNYHQVFPFSNWLTNPEWNKALFKDSLMQAESRVQLLNYISTKPIDCPVAVIFGHAAAINWMDSGFADVGLKITDKLWESGFYADLIPSSEIASGALKIGEDGSIQYGVQRYAAAVLYNPEYEQQTTADFFVKASARGKTKLFRVGAWSKDFEGAAFHGDAALPASMKLMDGSTAVQGVIEYLKAGGFDSYTTCTPNNAHYGSSMVPGVSGHMRLLDGTVIHASGKKDVMGDTMQKTITVDGHTVSFDCVGIAAVRLDVNGKLEAMAAGGLKSFKGGDVEISMPVRADVALWKDQHGVWQGVLQGYDGAVPENLESLCKRWNRLNVPEPVQ
jgi:hypothetical protein